MSECDVYKDTGSPCQSDDCDDCYRDFGPAMRKRYWKTSCNIYDRARVGAWNVCCVSPEHAERAVEALNQHQAGSISKDLVADIEAHFERYPFTKKQITGGLLDLALQAIKGADND